MDELTLLADIHNPDVFCIVETWLANDINDAEISISGYHSCRLDRRRHGGGVLLYTSKTCITIPSCPNLMVPLKCFLLLYSTTQPQPEFVFLCFITPPPSSPTAVLDELCAHFESVIETSLNLWTLF